MLFLVVSAPRPERPSELAQTRQSFWPWIARYEARGVCRQIYARVGRGAVAVFELRITMHFIKSLMSGRISSLHISILIR
jgi:hypothetical protein